MRFFLAEPISEMVHNPWPIIAAFAFLLVYIFADYRFIWHQKRVKEMNEERKSYDELATILKEANERWFGQTIQHVKSGGLYDIVGVHFRESDMAVCIEYCPAEYRETVGNYATTKINTSKVKFARSVEEMGFGSRFVFVGGLA